MKNMTYSGEMPRRNGVVNFIVTKKDTIIDVISALFILLFAYTAINKFISYPTLKIVLKDYPLIGSMASTIAWALPVIESAVSILLFIPRFRRAGLYASLVLMSGFTLYLGYMLAFTPKLPCTCGGMLQKLTWPQHFAFNILFIFLAIIGTKLSKKNIA